MTANAKWFYCCLAVVVSAAVEVTAANALEEGAPSSSPEPGSRPAGPLVEKVRALAAGSQIPSAETFLEMLRAPRFSPVALAPASASPMRVSDLARRAASTHLRVGWVYRCSKCSNWHTSLAGGYAIAPDTVVTAFHVLETSPQEMMPGTGFPVIVRGENEILSISSVVAADRIADTVVLRVAANDLPALPLADKIEVGDAVYCLSDPFEQRGIFTAGIVNCLDSHQEKSANNAATRRMVVSTDWAPGSSGSAILDSCGNAVGHVDTVQTFSGKNKPARDGKNEPPAAVLTLHFAVPAANVRALLEKQPEINSRVRAQD